MFLSQRRVPPGRPLYLRRQFQQGSIAMTAPVSQAGGSHKFAKTVPAGHHQATPGVWRIRFFMPARYTEASLPPPR
jgi:hypothetical protein